MKQDGRMKHQPNRRQMLRAFANGFGMIGLAGLLSQESLASVVADAWAADGRRFVVLRRASTLIP